ncbi:MAG: putative glycolipid-binding domain-containing protein [Thermomicrobiales bacterium]|nr:putative glycolipid-binding domain-containing protein [Chloroflexia bacterium]
MSGNLVRVVQWMSTTWPAPDRCALSEISYGWELDGEAQAMVNGFPVEVKYTVRVDREWHTRLVKIRQVDYGSVPGFSSTKRCTLKRDQYGSWSVSSGNDKPRLSGISYLTDIDIQVTPATNTLPIRRLNLAVGESAEVTAAWFRIPEFKVEPLRQRYTRLAEDTYGYESPDHDFTATLTVDDLGLVVNYDPGWVRLASTDAVRRD